MQRSTRTRSFTLPISTLMVCGVLMEPAIAQDEARKQTAADNETGAVTLDTMRVDALRIPLSTSAVPNTVTIIEQESLEAQTSVTDDLSGVLGNLVPNFSPSRQKLTSSGESLRGRSPLYMIDGVPQSNPLRDGARDGHTIDPDLLGRVEVVNGSNAVQGLGAAGGIINLQTRDAALSEDWTHIIKLRTTTPDDFDSDGFGYKGVYIGGRQIGKGDVTVGATYQSRGLYYDADGRPIGIDTTQGDLADSASRNLMLKAGYDLTPDQRLQFMLNDYQLRGNGDYAPVEGDRAAGIPATSEPGSPEGDPGENDVTTATLDYSHNALWDGQLRTQVFYQDFAGLFGGGRFATFQDPTIAPDGTLFDQSQNESRKRGVKLSYSRETDSVPGLTVTGGMDYLEDETKQVLAHTGREWVPETTFKNWAPFLQLNQALMDGRLMLNGGLRYETAKLEVNDYTTIAGAGGVAVEGGEPEFDEVLPNFGAVYDLGLNWSVYGSYSEGFTMPDVGRVLRAVSTPGQRVENLVSLDPVISDNRELGVDYDNGRLNVHAAYFWSDSDLGSRLENVGGVYEVRREKTEIQGFELAGAYDLTDRVQVGALYSHIRGEYDSDDDGSVDTDLGGNNINPDRLNLYVAWDEHENLPVAGRFQVSHFFDRDFEGQAAPSEQNFDSYTLADLMLSKDTRVGTFRFGVENVFDEQYITYYSQTASNLNARYFAGRGRTFTLSYETQF